MATFTVEYRDVWEVHGEQAGLMDYPIFDEGYRLGLNQKIRDRYAFQEVGFETVDLFLHHLKRTMNENMPYFNQFYESSRLNFDPMTTIDLSTLTDSRGTGESTDVRNNESTSTTSNVSESVTSETPQVQLSGHENYATGMGKSTGTGDGTATSVDQGTATTLQESLSQQRMTGRQVAGSALLLALRESFINIDVMVLNSLQPLFMAVWNNNDVMPDSRYGVI